MYKHCAKICRYEALDVLNWLFIWYEFVFSLREFTLERLSEWAVALYCNCLWKINFSTCVAFIDYNHQSKSLVTYILPIISALGNKIDIIGKGLATFSASIYSGYPYNILIPDRHFMMKCIVLLKLCDCYLLEKKAICFLIISMKDN